GQDYPAIANVGVHPTFKAAKDPLCEAYLLKPPPFDLYGRRVAITFLAFLREERQFSCPEELTRQIGCDLKRAEEFFSQATDETGRPHGAF
ncbi:MAG: riboflavin kinase, partial [Clostridia bacterium]|nr:riboflavin kinase [Clostridia bacterium]